MLETERDFLRSTFFWRDRRKGKYKFLTESKKNRQSMLSSSINQKNCDTFSFSSFIFSFRGVRGKVASLGRVCNSCDFSAVELVMCNEAKNFSILRTTYSRMDKLSPDDATLHPVSCRTPPFLPFSQIKRYDVRLVAPTFKTYVHLR